MIAERYRIDTPLGRGGMGEVFRGTDLLMDRPVAIKLVRADRIGDEESARRFLREGRITARLDHPGVPVIFEQGRIDDPASPLHGRLYLAMQFIEGINADDLAAEHDPLPIGWAAAIAAHLPPDSALLVTADHGMVELTSTVDYDRTPTLREGVQRLGGEPRARHVYTREGAAEDVARAWREQLGADFAVLTRAEAIGRGWFGPVVTPEIAHRIGDLVVAAGGMRGIVRSGDEPLQAALIGHHGSLTTDELDIPLRTFRG